MKKEIPRQLIMLWEKMNEPYGVKSLKSEFVYANAAFSDLLNLPKGFNVEGRLDSELPARTAEYAASFQMHDRKVEALGQRLSSLEIHPFGREQALKGYIFNKTPFYSAEGECIGTVFHAQQQTHHSLKYFITDNKPRSIIFSEPSSFFTAREWEVIFLMFRGMSQKQIAQMLRVTPGTVRQKMHLIYQKAGVSSSLSLFEFCERNGWAYYVPPAFIRKNHILFEP
ncbi:helix-turn-helix transcriptional regulator [Serratia fonticola]|uniref:helix-turn-helix transcriptional regulator n=1 Tax=Serratia fonticola TaxID=47917 RepID=UPI000E0FBB3D|nr:helix-turn-helix transcriptional regulator [Serratia fonticola]